MKREFTASAFIVEDDRILLVHHAKYQKWIQPGGHVEADETPQEAAIREVWEETGLQVELIDETDIEIVSPNAKSIPRPYLCLLEDIPPHKGHPAHQHIDLLFLARIIPSASDTLAEKARWFTREEVEGLMEQQQLFVDLYQVIKHLLTQPSVNPHSSAGR